MFTFTRSIRLVTGVSGAGYLADPMPWANALTKKASEISVGRGFEPFRLWTHSYSQDNAVLLWTLGAETWASIEVIDDALGEDSDFLTLVAQGINYTSSEAAQDSFYRILENPSGIDLDNTRWVTVWRASALPNEVGRAADAGIEIAQHVSKLGGSPTTVAVAMTGGQGSFEWKAYHDSVDSMAHALQTLDSENLDFLTFAPKQTRPSFDGASVTRRILRKIA